jgi:hypothetical protein
MIPNKECMKDILKFVSENAKIKVDDMAFHNITVSTLNISMILEQMSKEGEYTIEEIAYNFLQCYYNGLINANINFQQKMIQSSTSDIIGITFAGIDFMNQD